MKLIPDYHVFYDGTLHPPGVPFEIRPQDEHEMRHHGTVESESPVVDEPQETEPVKQTRRGRPKRAQEGTDLDG